MNFTVSDIPGAILGIAICVAFPQVLVFLIILTVIITAINTRKSWWPW